MREVLFLEMPAKHFTELIDKCVGSRIWVVMKGDKGSALRYMHSPSHHHVCFELTYILVLEFSGTLLGFDDYVSTYRLLHLFWNIVADTRRRYGTRECY